MTDQLSKLDDSIERLANLADELEYQVAPCPASRKRLVAWLADLVRSPAELEVIERNLPELPEALTSAYNVWIHENVHP